MATNELTSKLHEGQPVGQVHIGKDDGMRVLPALIQHDATENGDTETNLDYWYKLIGDATQSLQLVLPGYEGEIKAAAQEFQAEENKLREYKKMSREHMIKAIMAALVAWIFTATQPLGAAPFLFMFVHEVNASGDLDQMVVDQFRKLADVH